MLGLSVALWSCRRTCVLLSAARFARYGSTLDACDGHMTSRSWKLDSDFRSSPKTASVAGPPQRARSSRPESSLPRPELTRPGPLSPPSPLRFRLGGSTKRTRCLTRSCRPRTHPIRPSLPIGVFAPLDQSTRPVEHPGNLPDGRGRFPFAPHWLLR